jgi:hypothetical protein
LRKGVALNSESLNTRHDEHSTRSKGILSERWHSP